MREQRQEFYGTGEVLNGEGVEVSGKTEFVCKPCASNITGRCGALYYCFSTHCKHVEIFIDKGEFTPPILLYDEV